eukprot:scaffold751_cov213-Alexandrium_tamarense.AAC.2
MMTLDVANHILKFRYRDILGGWYDSYTGFTASTPSPTVTFTAGLLSGLTEAILIVTPAEVCKIRMQSQYHSLIDPSHKPQMHAKYKNVVQTAALIVKEEGPSALYKGVVPTMMRQGCNQAVNFSVYNWSKKKVLAWKKSRVEEQGGSSKDVQLDHWQSLLLGGLSGGMGPLVNNPLGELGVVVVFVLLRLVCIHWTVTDCTRFISVPDPITVRRCCQDSNAETSNP